MPFLVRVLGVWLARVAVALACLMSGPLSVVVSGDVDLDADWRRAARDRVGLAPDPAVVTEAVVQVYGARAFNWRGIFGIHTWIATKPARAPTYTIHQVLGWYARRGGSSVVTRRGFPDREWYGSAPRLLAEVRGPEAARAIAKLERALADYPYARRYAVWPGPNSNTFVAYLARRAPELRLDLPPSAIGKDYLDGRRVVASTPSGTGIQLSIWGLAGVLVGAQEGWEINVLGLGFGIDPGDGRLRLPGVGFLPLGRPEALDTLAGAAPVLR